MKRAFLVVLSVTYFACGGPSSEGQGVKTPDDLLAEQERLAEEQEREREKHGSSGSSEESDLEKKAKFDKRQADLEMKRAARSAETCPGSVPEDSPAGSAKVTVTFGNDGHAKSATITSPYDENAVGKCAINAFNSVIVPPFEGAEETMEWEVNFPEKEKKEEKKDPKKKGK
ncbi:MAG: hypothetical protein HS104_37935 [Polyangiaceae bacterium]|nr:hypothetical protein [Polyangiaceae bacterium]MCE7891566.1 hypothetical protein [Sorangiineae bacterium PRO1]MCL4749886.1 hypothetical protein [Myxococcales bacterium]